MKYVCCQEEENMIKLLKNWIKIREEYKILIWINNDQNHPGELPEE